MYHALASKPHFANADANLLTKHALQTQAPLLCPVEKGFSGSLARDPRRHLVWLLDSSYVTDVTDAGKVETHYGDTEPGRVCSTESLLPLLLGRGAGRPWRLSAAVKGGLWGLLLLGRAGRTPRTWLVSRPQCSLPFTFPHTQNRGAPSKFEFASCLV